MKTKVKFAEKDKKDIIEKLKTTLVENETKLKSIEKSFQKYKENNNAEPLSNLLLKDAKRRSETEF